METFLKFLVGVIVVGVIFTLCAISPLIAYSTAEDVTFTVEKTERVVDSGGKSSRYLVYTKNETFEDTDSLWYWKWNSSDVYGQLSSGKTYQAKVYGFRIPLLSWYRNIVTIQATN